MNRERIEYLDALKGFAVLVIFMTNMAGFANSIFVVGTEATIHTRADVIFNYLEEILVEGKFNAIFSMLFGFGFALQFEKIRGKNDLEAEDLYMRRLLLLLGVGVAHGWLLWPGDVLHIYASIGIVLLYGVRHASDRGIVNAIIGCAAMMFMVAFLKTISYSEADNQHALQFVESMKQSNAQAYGAGGFMDMVRENIYVMNSSYLSRFNIWNMMNWWLSLALTTLTGYLIARFHMRTSIAALSPSLSRAFFVFFLPATLAGMFVVYARDDLRLAPGAMNFIVACFDVFVRPWGAIGYCLLIIVLLRSNKMAWVSRGLSVTGKMTTSSYLMQSAMSLFIFRGWGLGYWAQWGQATYWLIGLALFWLIQVPISSYLLYRFGKGPYEALTARLIYKKAAAT